MISLQKCSCHANCCLDVEGYSPDDDVANQKKRTSNYVAELTPNGDIVIPVDNLAGFTSVQDKQAFVQNYFTHSYSMFIDNECVLGVMLTSSR